jgi:hypothetical protein
MDKRNNTVVWIAGLLSLSILGCASQPRSQATYHDPNMDFGLVQVVAVLPFVDLSQAGKAGDKVRDVFMTMLQAQVDVYVVPPGEVARSVSRLQPEDPAAPTAEEVIRLAENLEADVLITGTVLQYGEVRSGSAAANVCTLSVKMFEGQTGTVVWSASATRGGVGATERLLGGGGQPMNIVTSQAVSDIIDQLFQ